jgi:DNA polymerase (family 10)
VSEHLTVHLIERSRYGITLLLATGSAQHVDGLRALAATEGFRLDGQGLRRGCKIVAAKEEEDIYAALGLPFIAPELREGQGEIQRALKRKLPKMVSDKDI